MSYPAVRTSKNLSPPLPVRNLVEYRSRSVSSNFLSKNPSRRVQNSDISVEKNLEAKIIADSALFKTPDSPSLRLSKLRISGKQSPITNKVTGSSESEREFERPENRSPLRSRTSELNSPITSQRTPRRACKDEALAKIMLCFEYLTTEEKYKNESVKRSPAKRISTLRTCNTPKTYSSDEDYTSGDDFSSSPTSSSSLSSSSSSSSDGDEFIRFKRPMSNSKVGSKTKVDTPKMVSVPKRTGVNSTDSPSLSLKFQGLPVTDCLPCREREFDAVFEFIIEHLQSRTGGCMYISGVPGTGKTATVTAVLNSMTSFAKADLGHHIPEFTVVCINGMQVSEPRQAYVQIYEELTGTKLSALRAMSMLEAEFCSQQRLKQNRSMNSSDEKSACILLIDELDLLCSKRQDVLYSLFDWPCRQTGKRPLIVIAIANTMDLPERILHHRVASRLGLNRIPFAPYSHEQLATIVRLRLGSVLNECFEPKAIELATRKVAAVSGDARRSLDICRRAAEIAKLDMVKEGSTIISEKLQQGFVTMVHVNKALKEMFSSVKLVALSSVSFYEKILLRAIVSETSARSSEEVRLDRCMEQAYALCALEGVPRPTETEIFSMCAGLGAYKLILVEPSRRDTNMLIRLNCSQSDVLLILREKSS